MKSYKEGFARSRAIWHCHQRIEAFPEHHGSLSAGLRWAVGCSVGISGMLRCLRKTDQANVAPAS